MTTQSTQTSAVANDRDSTIKAIKSALKRRSGKPWSVTGGRGTSWGWIRITAPPARCILWHRLKFGMDDRPENYESYLDPQRPGGSMTDSDRAELGTLLGLDRPSYSDGESIPAGSDYHQEYIDRAHGKTPSRIGKPYCD